MMMITKWFLWLVTYSVIGWIYESIVCSIDEKKLVNRGFLTGPICPVYGVGALVSLFFLDHKTDNVFLLFFAGMLLTCTVEYLTAVLLEKLFDAKWWDYSEYRFNIQGRVSLLGAVVFGTLTVLLIKYIHPFISGLIDRFPDWALITFAICIFVVIMTDLYITVRHLLLLNGRLKEIQGALNSFLEPYTKRAEELKDNILDKFEESEYYSEHIKKLFSLSRFQDIRLAAAFPKLKPIKYNDAWQKLKRILLRKDG